MEFRKVFDRIPEQFDRWRPSYCAEAFQAIAGAAGLDASKRALEIGPGTGQATEPILQTGCDYLAIELGPHLAAFMADKFAGYGNFHIVNDDFITHEFEKERFDLVYSAATIQWIPEEIGFSKAYAMLKPGGVFAMMYLSGEYRTPNEALYEEIQRVYDAHFRPEERYTCHLEYENVVNYGFADLERRTYPGRRVFTADEYVGYLGTHCDHIVLPEPHRTPFFSGIREAILRAGNRLVMNDTTVLYLARKPRKGD